MGMLQQFIANAQQMTATDYIGAVASLAVFAIGARMAWRIGQQKGKKPLKPVPPFEGMEHIKLPKNAPSHS